MRSFLKNIYSTNNTVRRLLIPIKMIYDYYRYNYISDEKFIKIGFKKSFGYELNLNKPKTLNEKIQWLKLNDRTALHTICADKIAVRDYVKKKIGDNFLIPIYKITDNFQDLNINSVPRDPFIIKTNHDSGSYKIVMDKDKENWSSVRKYFKKALKIDYYKIKKEWQYKDIIPKILIEKLLITDKGDIPMDYKFHCFNGKVEFISIDGHRGKKNHFRNWYDKEWNRTEFYWSSLNKLGCETLPDLKVYVKPIRLNEMMKLAEILSEDFAYVRVDLYLLIDKIYFGEITFHHDSGLRPIKPKMWDYKLGQMLKLPYES